MKSPFKFLDAYTLDDRSAFFGREEEVAALYDMVSKNRLILVYGQSGTGKTSLIQCGLASHFDTTDWQPLYVRRQTDINQMLAQRLRQTSGLDNFEHPAEALEETYLNSLRPVYFIFDQLEELFILGSEQEQETFIRAVRNLLDAPAPCRILFVIREEYLAHLYGFERTVPTLFDRRLRVEPMSITKVNRVLEGSFQAFNITAEAPSEALYKLMIDQLSGEKTGIQLPYLQVYLDMLYGDAYRQAHPTPPPDGAWPRLAFTHTGVRRLGRIEQVLEKFLREQQLALDQQLRARFPGLGDNTVQQVLDAFVSEEGTKRPIGFTRTGEGLQVEKRWQDLFNPLRPDVLDYCCQLLEQARLLRSADGQLELAHDALADLIDRQRSDQQRRLNEAYRRLQNNFREYRDTGEYLSRKQLNTLEDLLPLLDSRLDDPLKQYVATSFELAEKLEKAELEEERRKRRQARRVAIAGLSLSGIALLALLVALQQFHTANRARSGMIRNAIDAQQNIANTLKVQGKYDEAIGQLRELEAFAGELTDREKAALERRQSDWAILRRYMKAGDSLTAIKAFRLALVQYDSARQLGSDTHIENLYTRTAQDLEAAFQQDAENGRLQLSVRQYRLAADNFRKALELKPEDPELRRLLEFCLQQQ